jgi:hypothetical protein
MHLLNSLSDLNKQIVFIFFALLVSVLISFMTFKTEMIGSIFVVSIFIAVVYFIFLFKNPRIGLNTLVIYSFLYGFIARELVEVPAGVFETLLVIIWIVAIIKQKDWSLFKNDLSALLLIWLVISIMAVINPEGASVEGWIAELRTIALYPLLFTVLGLTMIITNKSVNSLIRLFLILALIACLNGIKQQHLGLSANEQAFLDNGGASTHLLWDKLRIFSFYDAAQFGSFQAQFAIISIILAFGNFKLWKRIVLLGIACLFFYGMLLSGTRGVIIVIVVGAFTAIALSKNFKILVLGSFFVLFFLGVLKYTYIGNGSYEIYRLRSALNPEDASLNVRFSSQQLFAEYLRTRPFGGGVGVTGHFGHKFNGDKYLSTIEPDSFWVKVWVMYGIVGFVFWFCMYMYIIGKGCGIVWNIKNDKLRIKLTALLSGATGVFFCSYGNEIMNIMPSLIVVSLSWAMVYQGQRLDRELQLENVELN